MMRLLPLALALLLPAVASAHPLGNFTISHFSGLRVGPETVAVRYALDFAEIPALDELRALDRDGDGRASDAERDAYLRRRLPVWEKGLALTIGAQRLPLRTRQAHVEVLPGTGSLKTVRLTAEMAAALPPGAAGARALRFRDGNYAERAGWKEIVLVVGEGASVTRSSVPERDLSAGLTRYPDDLLMAPPQVSEATATVRLPAITAEQAAATATLIAEAKVEPAGRAGVLPGGGARPEDRFARLITLPELTPLVMLAALGMAVLFGALHALSPGHGKTVVAAYLVGSRGTPKHALWLGATVTLSHTAGVFALGLVTLVLSRYILPERLYPWLGALSGLAIAVIGVNLFLARLRGQTDHRHDHSHEHGHSHSHEADHDAHDSDHDHERVRDHSHTPTLPHSHTHSHSHAPPDGPISLRSLIALGIAGGIVPCPSALMVLLSAIALHRVGFGLLLIVAFSLGLASVLVGIGLLVVSGRRLAERFSWNGPALRAVGLVSPLLMAGLGLVIAGQSLGQGFWTGVVPASVLGALTPLGLGFVLGLKHAVETDHVVAVSTIAAQSRGPVRSAVAGAMWGVGHTVTLLLAGVAVLLLGLRIPEHIAVWFEFGVALMLLALGARALWRGMRGKTLPAKRSATTTATRAHPGSRWEWAWCTGWRAVRHCFSWCSARCARRGSACAISWRLVSGWRRRWRC
jgi:nickel/cobalt transporter (NicO) family protein